MMKKTPTVNMTESLARVGSHPIKTKITGLDSFKKSLRHGLSFFQKQVFEKYLKEKNNDNHFLQIAIK